MNTQRRIVSIGRRLALLGFALMAAMAVHGGVTCLFEGATMKVLAPASHVGAHLVLLWDATDKGADPAKVGAWHFCEHMIVEKGDGTLWMLIRTGNLKLMESFSRDQGRTWSDPVKTVNIAQISARFGFAKLPNGHLVFIKNGTTPTVETASREKLCAFVSDDEGLTWKGGLLIDERKRVCYPDTNVAPDGSIYITYDHDRNTKNRDELLMARFTEADILAGRIVTEGSFLKRVVFQEKGGTTK